MSRQLYIALCLAIGFSVIYATEVRSQVEIVIQSQPGSAVDTFDPLVAGKTAGEDSTLSSAASLRRLTNIDSAPSTVHRALIAEFTDSLSAREAIQTLLSVPDVISVEFSRSYAIDAGHDDPFADSSAHLPLIKAPEAWSISKGSRNVRVGLVDTGLFFEHPDLAGQVWINSGEDLNGNGQFDTTDLDGVDSDGNGWIDDVRGYDFVDRRQELEMRDFRFRDHDASDDGSGHGTNVAGILAALSDNNLGSSGVAPGVSIVPLRAFAADGIGSDVDIAAAVVYAADMGLEVLNLSFGDVYESAIMRTAIEYAASVGTTIIASGGNTGGDSPHYPSDYPQVISVVWLNTDGTGAASRATHGVGIDLGAPGSQIFTTLLPLGDDVDSDSVLYGRRSGSSMAAPMVAGAAAILKSIDPGLTPVNIRDILTASASDIDSPGWDDKTAAGRLNTFAAVTSILPSRVEITSPQNNSGISADASITGYALHADMMEWSVQITEGDSDLNEAVWIDLNGGIEQVYDNTLATFSVTGLFDGLYTLRLMMRLKDGRVIEDRRRVYVDRTPPVVAVRFAGPALIGSRHGIFLDIESDDVATATIEVGGHTKTSDRLARIHGLQWVDATLAGGSISAQLRVANTAGLETRIDTVISVPAARPNAGLLSITETQVPAGFLLQQPTDMDGDGLREIVFNRFEDGWLGDTLLVAEYSGDSFIPVLVQIANVFPRDAGDTDGDGLLDILTQVGPATLILEQVESNSFALQASLVDTSSISNPSQDASVWPAALVDVDDDGTDEVLTHNTSSIRILRADNGTFQELITIDNPTGFDSSELNENTFEQPAILEGDFDGDGLANYLIGDGDGDIIMLEQDGNGSVRISWSFETDRYSAATRYGAGDFDGDGITDFVSYTRNWLASTGAGEREPDLGIYYFWRRTGDDNYVLDYTVGVPGIIDRHGSMAALDVDADGNDELVLIDSPDLFVLDRTVSGEFSTVFYLEADSMSGPRSATVVAADFESSGQTKIVYADSDGFMRILQPVSAASDVPTPEWVDSRPLGSDAVRIEWSSYGADSVTVFVARGTSSFDPLVTTDSPFLVDSTESMSTYALVGWFGGLSSSLSPPRRIDPHNPASIVGIEYPTTESVKISFTEKLLDEIDEEAFELSEGAIGSVLLAEGGRAVLVNATNLPNSRSVMLRLMDVRDDSGLVVADDSVALTFPERTRDYLVMTSWEVRLSGEVTLQFSEALSTTPLPDAGNFEVNPTGIVQDVIFDAASPSQLIIRLSDINLTASGLNPTLTVSNLSSESGKMLPAEGNTVRLIANASDLSNILIYPNPLDVTLHAEQVRFAGLPSETSVSIFTVDGLLIRRFSRTESAGEVVWDTQDKNGALVPSGVYLVRFEHTDSEDTIRKVALIR
ncbi:MAG: S8 family serine peptidase [Rhodothermales bacterium]|nr:S8 family serine peptidase [Rhodothermales bacterium]